MTLPLLRLFILDSSTTKTLHSRLYKFYAIHILISVAPSARQGRAEVDQKMSGLFASLSVGRAWEKLSSFMWVFTTSSLVPSSSTASHDDDLEDLRKLERPCIGSERCWTMLRSTGTFVRSLPSCGSRSSRSLRTTSRTL